VIAGEILSMRKLQQILFLGQQTKTAHASPQAGFSNLLAHYQLFKNKQKNKRSSFYN
jgi:hypothetical protein